MSWTPTKPIPPGPEGPEEEPALMGAPSALQPLYPGEHYPCGLACLQRRFPLRRRADLQGPGPGKP